MEALNEGTAFVKEIISSDLFVAFVLFVSMFFCIRLIFPQFRFFPQMMKSLREKDGEIGDGISPWQAFTTALGSRVGVGNIAGVATAIALGGPGAVCWIWIFGVFGSAVALTEAVLGQAYKIRDGDEYLGGPAYYISRGLKNQAIAKFLSKFFAVCAIIACGVLMPGVQSNTVVDSIQQGFHWDKTIVIIVAAIIIALIIWGGIKRIGRLEAFLTPIKCFAYLAFALVVIIHHAPLLGDAFATIFSSAFGLHPIFGAAIGSAIGMGVRRGIFSTDVGYGAGAIFASAARCNHPVKQGLLQALSVLLSTLIICTATALIILVSGNCEAVDVASNAPDFRYFGSIEAGAGWVQAGLETCELLSGWGPKVLAAMVAIFAVGTIIGYYYLVENNLRYLMGRTSKVATSVVKIVFVVVLVLSTMVGAKFIWNLADIGLGVQGWINLIVLLILSPKVVKIVKDYSKSVKAGQTPVFKPEKFGIDDTTGVWENK